MLALSCLFVLFVLWEIQAKLPEAKQAHCYVLQQVVSKRVVTRGGVDSEVTLLRDKWCSASLLLPQVRVSSRVWIFGGGGGWTNILSKIYVGNTSKIFAPPRNPRSKNLSAKSNVTLGQKSTQLEKTRKSVCKITALTTHEQTNIRISLSETAVSSHQALKSSVTKNSSMELAVIWGNFSCSDLAHSDLAHSDFACSNLACSDLAHWFGSLFCLNSYFFHSIFTTGELI